MTILKCQKCVSDRIIGLHVEEAYRSSSLEYPKLGFDIDIENLPRIKRQFWTRVNQALKNHANDHPLCSKYAGDIDCNICLECGQIQGKWPVADSVITIRNED